ncbi:hypothetical protein [Prevotella corporis]|uniref:hypothetical protein n=1 Tax=Prevotella corporis TaxID=28128 RepID=UPI0023F01FBC|nr:hypothetical protein [Prevotella corporis]
MGKTIKSKADKAFLYPKDEDTAASMLEKKSAYIKGYEQALKDMKRHLNIAAIAGKSFMVLDMYKWIERRLED